MRKESKSDKTVGPNKKKKDSKTPKNNMAKTRVNTMMPERKYDPKNIVKEDYQPSGLSEIQENKNEESIKD